MRAPLTIAVAQPRCVAKDVAANAREHAAMLSRAHARIVAFPELSLTGYELDAAPVAADDPALASVVEACRDAGCIALVGAPVAGSRGDKHIGVLRVDSGGVSTVYRKSFLGADEASHFTPAGDPAAIEIDGWRVGLGVCRDTGIERHVRGTAALGIDLYLAGLVDRPDDRAVQLRRARHIARTCDAYVGFATFAGPTGGGFSETLGSSSIWDPAGETIASAGLEPDDFVRATLT